MLVYLKEEIQSIKGKQFQYFTETNLIDIIDEKNKTLEVYKFLGIRLCKELMGIMDALLESLNASHPINLNGNNEMKRFIKGIYKEIENNVNNI